MSETYMKNNIELYKDFYYQHGRNDLYCVSDEIYYEAYMDSLNDIQNNEFDLGYMIENIDLKITVPV